MRRTDRRSPRKTSLRAVSLRSLRAEAKRKALAQKTIDLEERFDTTKQKKRKKRKNIATDRWFVGDTIFSKDANFQRSISFSSVDEL